MEVTPLMGSIVTAWLLLAGIITDPGWIAVVASAVTGLGVGLDKINYYRKRRNGSNVSGQIDKCIQRVDTLAEDLERHMDTEEKQSQRLRELIGELSGEVHELKGYVRAKANSGL